MATVTINLFDDPMMKSLAWVWYGLAVASVVLAVLSYQRTPKPLSGGKKALLVGLRLLAVVAMLLCLFRPNLSTTTHDRVKGKLYFAVDTSTSMETEDATDPIEDGTISRRKRVALLLRDYAPRLDDLEEVYDVTYATFSDDAGRQTYPDRQILLKRLDREARGKATDLSAVLHQSLHYPRALLLTDGRDNIGKDAVATARHLRDRTQVSAIGIGAPNADGDDPNGEVKRDVYGISMEIADPNNLSLNAPTDIGVRFGFRGGFPTEPLSLRLLVDGKEVARQKIEKLEELYTFRDQKFSSLGIHRVRVETDPILLYREVDPPKNNFVEMPVRVVKDTLTVRLIEDFRWEARFLTGAFADWNEVDFLMVSGLTDKNAKKLLPTRLVTDPVTGEAGWDQVDVIIIGNVDRATLGDERLKQIAERVDNGAGLLMIGGRRNFAPGGYIGSAIEALLPVKLRPDDRYEDVPVKLVLTEAGKSAYLGQLEGDPAINAAAWPILPKGAGLSRLGPKAIKDGADLILETDKGEPVLVTAPYGGGRVIALLTESTWTWQLNNLPEPVHARTAVYHKRFWRKMIRWLAHRKQDGVNLRVETFRPVYKLGDEIVFVAQVFDERGLAITDADVTLTLTDVGPDGNPRLDKTDQPLPPVFVSKAPFRSAADAYRVAFRPEARGSYRVVATAVGKDKTALGSDEIEIDVRLIDEEVLNPATDFETLQAIQTTTGGQFALPPKFEAVLAHLIDEADGLSTLKAETRREKVWGTKTLPIAMLALFCAALAAEWFLRKRFGLV